MPLSASGALLLSLSALLILGAVAAWLLNIPPLAIGVFLVGGVVVLRRLVRRLSRSRARQETETPV